MRFIEVCIFIVVVGVTQAQFEEIPLFEPANFTESQPLIEVAQEKFESLTEGLSIKEVAAQFPAIFNETASELLVFENPKLMAAVYEGIFRSANGTDIITQVLKEPQIFAQTLLLLVSNVDIFAAPDPQFRLLVLLLDVVMPLLNEQFRDFLGDLITQSTIIVTLAFNASEPTIAIFEPWLESLEQTGDIQGVLGDIFSLAQEEAVSNILFSALEDAGLETSEDTVSSVLAQFFQEVQKALDFDDSYFLEFLKNMFQVILDGIR